jgi:uncharacterized protein (TIGR02588 family)
MKGGTNWLEWTVLGISGLLVAGSAGVLVWEAATNDDGPPAISLTLGEPRQLAAGWAVPVTATNRGGTTAENVLVEVQLGADPEAPRGQLDLPFLPRGSRRSGWVSFDRAPAAGSEPRARVVGYGEP